MKSEVLQNKVETGRMYSNGVKIWKHICLSMLYISAYLVIIMLVEKYELNCFSVWLTLIANKIAPIGSGVDNSQDCSRVLKLIVKII